MMSDHSDDLDDSADDEYMLPRRSAAPQISKTVYRGKGKRQPTYGSDGGGGLRVLSPQDILVRESDLTLDVYEEPVGYESSDDSDEEEDLGDVTSRTSRIFGRAVAEPRQTPRPSKHHVPTPRFESDDDDDGALVPFEDEYDDLPEVTSEEETDIMREIRAEITAQVQEEMKQELQVYRDARQNLQETPVVEKLQEQKNDDLAEMEPKVREAMIKMRKLDRILAKKVRREREVKKERILLQRRLKAELENIRPEGREEAKEIKTNTNKFLALELPASHNAGVIVQDTTTLECDDDRPAGHDAHRHASVTPVFQTQVLDDSSGQLTDRSRRSKLAGSNAAASSTTNDGAAGSTVPIARTAHTNSTRIGSDRRESDSSTSLGGGRASRKNFIKRNIELASDSAETIAMTDDEKQRLEDLLKDIDTVPEFIPEDGELQLALRDGGGFTPETQERQRLTHIDSRLKDILPAEDYQTMVATTPSVYGGGRDAATTPRTALFTNTAVLSTIDVDGLGERALRDTRLQREQKQRLNEIEQQLRQLSTAVTHEIESPSLPEEQLQDLLEQCSRTMIRATEETDSVAAMTERSAGTSLSVLLENPPHLADDVLQQLLADARSTNQLLDADGHLDDEDTYRATSTTVTPQPEYDILLQSITEEEMTSARSARLHGRQSITTPSGYNSYALSQRHNNHSSSGTTTPAVPFLPKIDPTGRMSTQRLHDNLPERRQSADMVTDRSKQSADVGRTTSSLSRDGDADMGRASVDYGSPVPRPPSDHRK